MSENPADLLPELCALLGAVLGLVAGLFLPRTRQWIAVLGCCAALAAGLVFAVLAAFRPDAMTFDAFLLDPVTHVTRITVLAGTLAVLGLAAGPVRGHPRETEFSVLTVLAALGTILLGASSDLLVLVAAYLLASIPAYALAGFGKDAPGTEAALKYYLLGAFFGIFMLTGVTLLYGLGRATAYEAIALPDTPAVTVAAALVLAGLLFKAGAVPGHFWVPDVSEGAPPVVAAFVTTVPKIGAFAALYRLGTELEIPDRTLLLALIAVATMTLGNLAAFGQRNVRRLLAYSTVSQAGYLLIPVAMAGRTDLAEPALLFYLGAYAVTNLGAFAVVVAAGEDDLPAYAGLARRSPALALALAVCLLGLVGTPPTAVFVGKLLMFGAAVDGAYAWLAVAAALNSVASVYYYLRWIVPVFGRGEGPPAPVRTGAAAIACAAALASVAMGAAGGLLLG
ncbi:NADH-quinone oxidoreductase subunit N [Spirillospora sp. NPDC029432]|uniref:NADH-quinone oxidoreductase subunit N n=1 Tax=Spirillospora sp. NPDC029432 TaxID=3154599 RepID=UPI003453B42E